MFYNYCKEQRTPYSHFRDEKVKDRKPSRTPNTTNLEKAALLQWSWQPFQGRGRWWGLLGWEDAGHPADHLYLVLHRGAFEGNCHLNTHVPPLAWSLRSKS